MRCWTVLGVVEQRLRRRLKDANSVELHTTCSHPYCYNKSSASRHLLLRRIWGLHRAGKLDTAAVSSTAVSVYCCCVSVSLLCLSPGADEMQMGKVGGDEGKRSGKSKHGGSRGNIIQDFL